MKNKAIFFVDNLNTVDFEMYLPGTYTYILTIFKLYIWAKKCKLSNIFMNLLQDETWKIRPFATSLLSESL